MVKITKAKDGSITEMTTEITVMKNNKKKLIQIPKDFAEILNWDKKIQATLKLTGETPKLVLEQKAMAVE